MSTKSVMHMTRRTGPSEARYSSSDNLCVKTLVGLCALDLRLRDTWPDLELF